MESDLIRLFCYLDVATIESLDAQTGDFILERTSSRTLAAKGAAGAESATLLHLLLPWKVNAEVGGELSQARGSTAEIRPEHRLEHVLSWLEKKRQLKVIRNADDPDNPENGWVVMHTRFETPDLTQIANLPKLSPDGYAPAFVQFYSTYRAKPLVMAASLAKFRISLHHYLISWGASSSSPTAAQLWVFGLLSGTADRYALKPLAIAHQAPLTE